MRVTSGPARPARPHPELSSDNRAVKRSGGRRSNRRGLVAATLILLIEAYRRGLSWWLPSRCRFYPSCSAYALEAVRVHGAARGAWLAIGRVLRCHPFHPGGIDRVPRPKPGSPR